jgi:hypothetical protein
VKRNVELLSSALKPYGLYTGTSPVSADAGKMVWVSSREMQISVDKALLVVRRCQREK